MEYSNTLPLPQLLSEKQASRVLAVSVGALRRWRRERRGPEFTHLERCVRYEICAIERFVRENSSANKKAADSRSAAEAEVRDGHAARRTD